MAHNQKYISPITGAPTVKPAGGLGVWALAAIVVSSMIGGGIYSLPQNMAQGASVGAVLLAWLITGIGVYFGGEFFRIRHCAYLVLYIYTSDDHCGHDTFDV